MRQFALVLASLLVVGCADKGPKLDAPVVTTLPNGVVEVKNSGPSSWADTSGWKLVELYRVGGADAEGLGAEELVDPQSVAIDPAGGIYVVDQKPAVVKQFSPTGQYVRSFGREGRGPGEFQVGFVATGPGVFVLHDPQSSRTSVFDSAGTFVRGWASSCCSAAARSEVTSVTIKASPAMSRYSAGSCGNPVSGGATTTVRNGLR